MQEERGGEEAQLGVPSLDRGERPPPKRRERNTLTDEVERVVFACPKEVSWVARVRLIDEEGVLVGTCPSARGTHHRARFRKTSVRTR